MRSPLAVPSARSPVLMPADSIGELGVGELALAVDQADLVALHHRCPPQGRVERAVPEGDRHRRMWRTSCGHALHIDSLERGVDTDVGYGVLISRARRSIASSE